MKRQYYIKGEVCDILAVDDNRRLVVMELKNTEDGLDSTYFSYLNILPR